MIHFVIIIDFLTATLNKKYVRVKQKKSLAACYGGGGDYKVMDE